MTVKVELKFSKADGSVPITMFDWIDTLPEERQHEFNKAKVREEAAQMAAETSSKRIHTDTNVEHWESEEDHNAHSLNEAVHDPVWKQYWDEYITENEIIFEHVISNVD